jgi:hypothetical protein
MVVSLVLGACATPTPATIVTTVEVPVVKTVEVKKLSAVEVEKGSYHNCRGTV